jgi:hypothetical protein
MEKAEGPEELGLLAEIGSSLYTLSTPSRNNLENLLNIYAHHGGKQPKKVVLYAK